MATEKWLAGAVASYTSAITASVLNSIVNGNAILSDVAIANTTNLDMFCEVGIQFGSITVAAPNFIGIYAYYLNQDASTYGDARFGTSAAGPPPGQYLVGTIGFPTGAAAFEGTCIFGLRPSNFKLVFYNQAGATLAGASGNTAFYRTWNRSIA